MVPHPAIYCIHPPDPGSALVRTFFEIPSGSLLFPGSDNYFQVQIIKTSSFAEATEDEAFSNFQIPKFSNSLPPKSCSNAKLHP
jgi:hypothetical protein